MNTEYMSKAELIRTKGWFTTAGRPGDRTLEQQMTGLEQLVAEVPGKTVLDVGCAEGLIGMELCRAGADAVIGLEIVPYHVNVGRDLVGDLPMTFILANLNNFDLSTLAPADIVIALSVLHKVKDPSRVCAALAVLAKDLCVIRLPPSGPVIVDARSENVPHDIASVMEASGFTLEKVIEGPLSEWLGYYRRKPVARATVEETVSAPAVVIETKVEESESKPPESATNPEQTASEVAKAASEVVQTESAADSVDVPAQATVVTDAGTAAKEVVPMTTIGMHDQAPPRGRGGRGSRGK